MSHEYTSYWTYQQQEESSRRQQRAEIAGLLAQADSLRAQAKALRKLTGAAVSIDTHAPGTGATSAELAAHAQRLRGELADATRRMDAEVNAAWTRQLSNTATARGSARKSKASRTIPRQADRRASGQHTSAREGAGRAVAQVERARTSLAGYLTRCHPADVDRLTGLAAGLRDDDTTGARALEASIVESLDRQRRGSAAHAVVQELLTLVHAAPEAERDALRAVVTGLDPDSLDPQAGGGPLEAARARIEAAVSRADRDRARTVAAAAVADTLRELGCDVGEDFADYLTGAPGGKSILALAGRPGHGVEVSLDAGTLRYRIVRQGQASGDDTQVQRSVCAKLDTALGALTRAGIDLNEQRRRPPGTGPSAVIDAERWERELRPAAQRSSSGSTEQQQVRRPGNRAVRRG